MGLQEQVMAPEVTDRVECLEGQDRGRREPNRFNLQVEQLKCNDGTDADLIQKEVSFLRLNGRA